MTRQKMSEKKSRVLRNLYNAKHYNEIANTLRGRRPSKDDCHYEFWLSIVHTFNHDFKKDNPNFKSEFFLEACGVK